MASSQDRAVARLMDKPLSRRTLLALAAGGVVSTTMLNMRLTGQEIDPSSIVALGERLSSSLPIAFWRPGDSNTATTAALVPAEGLRTGDASLADEGVRLSIRGVYPRSDVAVVSGLQSVTVDVSYEPFHREAFRALSFSNGGTPRMTSPVALNVPVDSAAGLNLSVSYQTTTMEAPRTVVTRFALDEGTNTAKLQRGTYFIGLPAPDSSLPSWSNYQVIEPEGATSCSAASLHCGDNSRGGARSAQHPFIMLVVR